MASIPISYAEFSPITIIEPSNLGVNTQFGYKLDSHGGRVLIADYSSNAYIYDGELVTLPVPLEDKLFESCIDINEDYIAIGYVSTHYNDLDGAGIVYLFDSDGEYLMTIYPPDPINWGHFGSSVLLGEDYLYVGEAWADHIQLDEGKVHLFSYEGEYIDSMVPPESSYAATFGAHLNGNHDWLVVSEINGVHGMLNNGEVHLYTWDRELVHTLKPLNSSVLNDFGAAVALSDDLIVVGESISSIEDYERAGRVYVFDNDGELLRVLAPPIPVDGGLFGFSVALNDEYIAVGEPRANGVEVLEGAVHIYTVEGEYVETLFSPLSEPNSEFGKSLVFCEDSLFVGQSGSTVDLMTSSGRVIEFSMVQKGPVRVPLSIVYGMILILLGTVALFVYKMRMD